MSAANSSSDDRYLSWDGLTLELKRDLDAVLRELIELQEARDKDPDATTTRDHMKIKEKTAELQVLVNEWSSMATHPRKPLVNPEFTDTERKNIRKLHDALEEAIDEAEKSGINAPVPEHALDIVWAAAEEFGIPDPRPATVLRRRQQAEAERQNEEREIEEAQAKERAHMRDIERNWQELHVSESAQKAWVERAISFQPSEEERDRVVKALERSQKRLDDMGEAPLFSDIPDQDMQEPDQEEPESILPLRRMPRVAYDEAAIQARRQQAKPRVSKTGE